MPSNTVVFDFDKTLISSDSTTQLILNFIFSNPVRIVAALLFIPIYACLSQFHYGRYFGAITFLSIARIGLNKRTIVKRERAFYSSIKNKTNKKSFLYNDGLETLKQYHNEGCSIVILSASPERVVRNILLPCLKPYRLNVRVIGTRGKNYCFGKNKINIAKQRGLVEWFACYTDSAHDFPILGVATQKFLVNPDKKTIQHARKHFGNNVSILNWS